MRSSSRGIEAGSCWPSASMKIRISPVAWRAPRLIAAPLPIKYGAPRTTATCARETSAVASVEPSSTTRSSAPGMSSRNAARVLRRPSASFFAGRMILMVDKSAPQAYVQPDISRMSRSEFGTRPSVPRVRPSSDDLARHPGAGVDQHGGFLSTGHDLHRAEPGRVARPGDGPCQHQRRDLLVRLEPGRHDVLVAAGLQEDLEEFAAGLG